MAITAPPTDAVAEAAAFLERVLPERVQDEVYLCDGWPTPTPRANNFTSTSALARYLVTGSRTSNVYFSPFTFRSPGHGGKGRKTGDALRVQTVWVDLDVGARKPFATFSDAVARLGRFPLTPHYVLATGHGLQAHWLLTEPSEDVSRHMAIVRGLAGHLDGDPAVCLRTQLLRVPGTMNIDSREKRKDGLDHPVRVFAFNPDAPELSLSDFEEAGVVPLYEPEPRRRERRPEGEYTADLARVQGGCAWLQHCYDDRLNLGEGEWYRMLSVVGRTIDGEAAAHEWSRDYPGYRKDETTRKLAHALEDAGPATCDYVERELRFGGCASCTYRGRITSPLQLGTSVFPERAEPSDESPGPRIVSAAELEAMDIPEMRWAVPGLLPEGLTLLAGRPKAGKSWMALNVAVSVALGERVMGKATAESGDVLYLALEDGPRRLKERLASILQGAAFPARLNFATSWSRFDDGGAVQLGLWLSTHPGSRLVVIDTLAKIRPGRRRNGNAYDEDYGHIGAIKAMADRFGVAVLVVHHTRKMPSDDPLDLVSGTLAISGAADAILVLVRTGEAAGLDAKLHVRGRDIEDADLAMRWWRDRTTWEIAGGWDDATRSGHRAQLFEALRDGPLSLKDLAAETGIEYRTLEKTVRRLVRNGELQRTGRGTYGLLTYEDVRIVRNESTNSDMRQGVSETERGTQTTFVAVSDVSDMCTEEVEELSW